MVKRKIVYEQPLNDRMRHLLRMELLFAGMMYRLKGPAEWDSRAVIDSIIDILDLNARVELKTKFYYCFRSVASHDCDTELLVR